jgi:phage-related protein
VARLDRGGTASTGSPITLWRIHSERYAVRALPEPFTATASGQVITILHAFVRKTQKTPKQELAKARQRLKEVKR